MTLDTLPIIDTHQHLWDLTQFRLGWLGRVPQILNRSFLLSDYLLATEGLNVVKTVYMEVDVEAEQQHKEASHALDMCHGDTHPLAGAVIAGRPESPDFSDYIARYAGYQYIKGVRRVLHVPEVEAGHCLEAAFISSVRELGASNLSFDLCMRPAELGDAIRLVDRCPGTQFIIDHCGNADPLAFCQARTERPTHHADQWRRDMSALADRDNVLCKISGIVTGVPKGDSSADILAPIVNHCLDEFGPDRVVFGGDWPVCLLGATYAGWVSLLREIISDRPLSEQRKLLHDNAMKWYRLPE